MRLWPEYESFIFYPSHDACDSCTKGCVAGAMATDTGAMLLPRNDIFCH